MKKIKLTTVLQIAMVVVFISLPLISNYYKSTEKILKKGFSFEIQMNYNGVIEKKYNDRKNHNSPMIRFTSGKKIGLNGYYRSKLQVGDPISKVTGDSVIQVFRNHQKFEIPIAPFYEKAIKEEQEK